MVAKQLFPTFSKHAIFDTENIPFSAASYSRFKFGDGEIAQQFGEELAYAFIDAYNIELLTENEIVLIASPYNSIPTASFAMASHFKRVVNHFLYQNNRNALLESKIHRYKTYSEDYGSMSYAERVALISSDTYHLDKTFLKNRWCLFVDDIKITGSHEYVICKQIAEKNMKTNAIFLYYAILQNAEIPPHFENFLNYYEVKNIHDLVNIINNPTFVLNTRTIKYLLTLSQAELKYLIESVSIQQLYLIVNQAISNNYHLMEVYKNNLSHIIHSKKYGN